MPVWRDMRAPLPNLGMRQFTKSFLCESSLHRLLNKAVGNARASCENCFLFMSAAAAAVCFGTAGLDVTQQNRKLHSLHPHMLLAAMLLR